MSRIRRVIAGSAMVLVLGAGLFARQAVSSQQAVRIETFSPQGTTKQVRQVVATFSEPIVAFGDPRARADLFDVKCPEKGSGRLIDARRWAFDFARDLPAGVQCEFTLKGDVTAVGGRKIEGQTRFTFTTGAPAIKNTNPYESADTVEEDQIFMLHLDGEVDEASIEAFAHFRVAGIASPVPLRVVTGKQREQLLDQLAKHQGPSTRAKLVFVQARTRFPVKAKIQLVWAKGIRSKSGVVAEQDQVLSYTTRPQFRVDVLCERESAASPCIPILPIRVGFSAVVSWKEAKTIVLRLPGGKVVHPYRGKDDTMDEVMWLEFRGPFPEKASLKIEIPASIVDDSGRKLENASKLPFVVETGEVPPLAKFAAEFGILEAADPVLPVTVRNIESTLHARALRVKGAAESIASWLPRLFTQHDRDRSIFSASERAGLKAFKLEKPGGANTFEIMGIPLEEPGFYIVELASDALGASLLQKPKTMYVQAGALVTNLAVHFKWGTESSLAWVTSLDHGKPVEHAEVEVSDCHGKVLWRGATTGNGVARIARLPSQAKVARCEGYSDYASGLFVSARLGRDFSFVHSSWNRGIEPWRFQLPYEGSSKDIVAHSVLDRSLLRAGETVHMKHVLRKQVMQGFARLRGAELPTQVTIEHVGGQEHYAFPLKWDSTVGLAETSWTIPKHAKLGTYQIILGGKEGSGTRLHSGEFRVEEFRLPLMHAHIVPPNDTVVATSKFPVDVSVQYLAGGGAAKLPAKLRTQVSDRSVSFAEFEDFKFADGKVKDEQGRSSDAMSDLENDEVGSAGERRLRQAMKGVRTTDFTLDAAGTARVVVSGVDGLDRARDVLAELEFRDPNGETQTVASHIAVYPSEWLVGLKPAGFSSTSDHVQLHAAVVDLKGQPIEGARVEVSAFVLKTYSHRKRLVGGLYAFEHFRELRKVGKFCEGSTDARGLLSCEGRSQATGNVVFEARVADKNDHVSFTNRDMWITDKDDLWFEQSEDDRIDVLPERKRYEPGETARLQVRMPFRQATALVTVEREGVTDLYVTELSGNDPSIELPIKGEYAPNAFVSVFLVRGRVGDPRPTALVDLGKPAYRLGLTELNVGWSAHALNVSVEPERRVYQPREKAKARIRVRLPDGAALRARGSEVAIAAVDEALLELSPNKTWDLLAEMMGRRGYQVQTSTAQTQVIGKRHFGLKAFPAGGGGGRQTTRELFDTLLFWKARVPLDANGEAAVEIPLNDSVTSFKIVAVATSGAQLFGTGEASIRSTQELMVLPGIAPIAREGDAFNPGVTLRNTTDREMVVEVSIKAEAVMGGEKSSGTTSEMRTVIAPRTVKLSSSAAVSVEGDLVVPTGATLIRYQIEARDKNGKAGDRVKVVQKIFEAVPVRTVQATLLRLEKRDSLPIERPSDAIADRGGVAIAVRARLADGLDGVREYMGAYPYDCLEQRVSTAIALRDPARWRKIAEDLPSYLDSSGLIKYFPFMSHGSDALTAYVLSVAAEAGYKLPAASLGAMLGAMDRFITGKIVSGYAMLPSSLLDARKLAAAAALARYKKFGAQHFGSIAVLPNLWPTSAVLDWFDVLRLTPDLPDAAARLGEAERILRARLDFRGTSLGFSTEAVDSISWLMVSPDLNAVRLVHALASSKNKKWMPELPRLARGALERQHRGHWDQTTANAWGVLAMEKFSSLFERIPIEGVSKAALGNETKTVTWLSSHAPPALVDLPWPKSQSELKLSHEGSGAPWVTVSARAAIPLKVPFSAGFHVQKKIFPVVQKENGKYSRGDILRVRLEIDSQADMSWVAVSDPIPAGATILGSGLGRDSQLATQGLRETDGALPTSVERAFDGYRAYFELAPKGTWTVEYAMRVGQEGVFQLPATRVEALYSPGVLGETPNVPFEVGKRH